MKNCSKKIWLAFAATTVAGACLHFLYDLRPALLTALLSPVNESLWEHLKILYWPCLIAGALLARGRREELAPRMAALLLSCAAMLAVGWANPCFSTSPSTWCWRRCAFSSPVLEIRPWAPAAFSRWPF